ncbi:MAG: isochorismatase family protein [Myxococcota bacterium]
MVKSENYFTMQNRKQKINEWKETIFSQVRDRKHLKLQPPKAALLVIDMINYFASPEGKAWLPGTAALVKNLQLLLNSWRTQELPVIFTRHCHRNQNELGMIGKFYSDYISCGNDSARIIDEFPLFPEDKVIRKTTYDAFYQTDLLEFLEEKEVKQVLVTGVMTNLCCETTARSAFVHGFEVYFPVDGSCTAGEKLHLASLLNLASGFARLTDIREVINCLEG